MLSAGCRGDYRPWDSPFFKFSQGGPLHPTRQFFGVDEALGLPALYACVRLLADSLASLPVKTYLKQPSGTGPTIRWNGPSLFDKPSVSGTIYDWLFQCMTALLLQGNAWGLITGRDGYGFPTGIEWVSPDDVCVVDDEDQPWNPLRARIYVYGRLMDRSELFHVKAFSVPGRTEGISPLRAFALTVTSGLEAERYGTDWYKSGGFPPGTFQNNEIEIDASQAAEIRASLVSSLRRREPLVYGRDWDYKPVVVPPSESQFLQACTVGTMRFSMADGTLKQADQLVRGDHVISWNGRDLVPSTIEAVWPEKPRPVIQIRTQCGRELTTSLNHPYWASRYARTPGGRYAGSIDEQARWLRADELNPGDYVRVALDWDGGGDLDPETGWALGALTGDGHLPENGAPGFTGKDPEILDRLGAWCADHGGALTVSDHKRPVNHRINTGPGSRHNPPRLRRELREWGILGLTAEHKRVPAAVMSGGRKAQAAFLSGYLDTDGTVALETAPQPIVKWTSVARKLLDDCQHLLALQGIQSAIALHHPAEARVIRGVPCRAKASWTLTVCGRANVQQLAGVLAPSHPVKAARLAAWRIAESRGKGVRSDSRWTRIIAIENAGEQTTYGVTVRGTHVHVTEGLITHNTQMNATQIAAVYGLPPDRVGGNRGDSLTYNTVEMSTLQIIEALRPWLVRLETAFFDIIPANRYIRFNTDALLKTDLRTRTEIYAQQRAIGMRTVDEIRDAEDMPPLPGKAGEEIIPLDVMVAMSRSIRGIPNSMLPGITLEMDLAADKLEQLQKEGLTPQPDQEPLSAPGPASLVGQMVGAARGMGDMDPETLADDQFVQAFLAARRRRRVQAEGPEYLGPWLPEEQHLATAANGNGNGHGSNGNGNGHGSNGNGSGH